MTVGWAKMIYLAYKENQAKAFEIFTGICSGMHEIFSGIHMMILKYYGNHIYGLVKI